MSSVSPLAGSVKIVLSDTLGPAIRNIVHRAKAYETIILLYEDELSGNVQAAWAERDRLQLRTKVLGQIMDGLQVHSFGMDDFPMSTVLELSLREASLDAMRQDLRRVAYRSLLNELCLINVRVYQNETGSMLLQ
ncbi:MAG: hypothetical protein K0Q50_1941 [Vampirovibrio sp.]|jgi:hypothetical protein|nr:hypothetical protein [Vampirovibrio sp.]